MTNNSKFIRWRADYSLLLDLEKKVTADAPDAAKEVMQRAKDIMEDLVTSSYYPPASTRGNPPAVREGVLSDAVSSAEIYFGYGDRSLVTGRFIANDMTVAQMQISTAMYHPRGEEYTQALEDEGYLGRYFVRPAFRRAETDGALYNAVKNLFDKNRVTRGTGFRRTRDRW